MITVGLTYDLKDEYLAQGLSKEEAAEFDVPETIDALEDALEANGYRVDRIGNLPALVSRLAAGRRWDIVFNICEGLKGGAREAQVPALLEAYGIPCVFSDAAVMVLCLDKALAKRVLVDAGIPTARFAVVRKVEDTETVHLTYPLFVKPMAEGTGKGIGPRSFVPNPVELRRACHRLLDKFRQPVLVEEYLPGRDLTVGIIGQGEGATAIGVMETFYRSESDRLQGQSYINKTHWEDTLSYAVVDDPVARQAAATALDAWRLLGCVDGGRVDLRCDRHGVPHFLEVNPLAGMRPGYSDFPMLAEHKGIDYVTFIGRIMQAACRRNCLTVTTVSSAARAGGRAPANVVVLYSGGEADALTEDNHDTLVQLSEVSAALTSLRYHVRQVVFGPSISGVERQLRAIRPDCVFNLVETAAGTDRLQYTATALLDHMGIPYTGASTAALAALSSKVQMKYVLESARVATPRFYCRVTGRNGVHHLRNGRWIVKSDSEHASVGLDAASVVAGLGLAERLIRDKEQRPGGRWFAEQYIDGREFNLALIGRIGEEPRFLPPAEIVFGNYPVGEAKIVDYDAKWNPASFAYQATQRRHQFSPADIRSIERMREISLRCWDLFGLSGAARIDFRLDADGVPWVIDINANPGLASDAGFMAAATLEGFTLRDIVRQLMPLEKASCFA